MGVQIMGDTLGTVHVRRKEDSKLRKTMASQKLEQTRGFGMGPDSTFHQGGNKSSTMRKTGILNYAELSMFSLLTPQFFVTMSRIELVE